MMILTQSPRVSLHLALLLSLVKIKTAQIYRCLLFVLFVDGKIGISLSVGGGLRTDVQTMELLVRTQFKQQN